MGRIDALYNQKMEELAQLSIQQGEVKLTIRQLKRLLGQLPVELEAVITSLPSVTVEALSEALLDFKKLEDLRQWLNAHQ